MLNIRTLTTAAAIAGAVALTPACANARNAIPAYIKAAVNYSGRPAKDKALDVDRRPEQTITFAGVKPGDTVLELAAGGGYYTRILSRVVGPKGTVYEAYPGKVPVRGMGGRTYNPLAAVTKLSHMAAYRNVVPLPKAGSALRIPRKADVVWTSDNYHDFHNKGFGPLNMLAFNKAVYRDLKHGGIYLIIDHATAPGKGMSETQTLHRSDPAATKREVLAAGFKPDGQSNALAHPGDDHTKVVFALHWKVDDYMLRFKKP